MLKKFLTTLCYLKLFILVVTPKIMGNCSNFPRSEKIRWDSRKNSLFITASRHSQHVIKQPSHVRLHVFWMYLVCCDLSKNVVCRRCVNRLRFWFDIKINEMKTKYIWVWVRLVQRSFVCASSLSQLKLCSDQVDELKNCVLTLIFFY